MIQLPLLKPSPWTEQGCRHFQSLYIIIDNYQCFIGSILGASSDLTPPGSTESQQQTQDQNLLTTQQRIISPMMSMSGDMSAAAPMNLSNSETPESSPSSVAAATAEYKVFKREII